jgi:hypothetical protein
VTIRILPYLDPRLIIVEEPQTEITQQDLANTVREWEQEPPNLSYSHLIDTSGKQDLGGNILVGITNTLQNTQVAFQSRTASVVSSTCTDNSEQTIHLIDEYAAFITDGVERGALIVNFTDKSVATVLSVESETELLHEPLADGYLNKWTYDDEYKIWNVIRCIISGGNLVAVNEAGETIGTVSPTAFTQINLTSSSSATLQEISAIRFASYGGGVSLDINNNTGKAISGTSYPAGTKEFPSNNVSDTISICNSEGFDTVFVIGNVTFGTGHNLTGKKIIGQNPVISTITVNSNAVLDNCQIADAYVQGTLDNNMYITHCRIGRLLYIDGQIVESMLMSTISLGGTTQTHIANCYSGLVDPNIIPTVNLGGIDGYSNLGMEGFVGSIKLTNLAQADTMATVNMMGGHVYIDSTISAGYITLRGITGVTDEHSGSAVVNTDDVVSPSIVTNQLATNNQYLIESLRTPFSAYGHVWYWSPYDGYDTNDGLSPDTAVETFARAHDLADAYHNDVIFALSKDPSGNTITTEQIVITKDTLQLRGSGTNFVLQPTETSNNTVTVAANNVSVEGFLIKTAAAGTTQCGIQINNATSTSIKNITVDGARSCGLLFANAEYAVIENMEIKNCGKHGIHSSGSSYCEIKGITLIHDNGSLQNGSGVYISDNSHGIHAVGEIDIHNNANVGVYIEAGSEETYITPNARVYSNGGGDFFDQGTTSFIGENLGTYQAAIYNNTVHIDTTGSGVSSTEFPRGTAWMPVDNIADAYDIGIRLGLYSFTVRGTINLDRDLTNWNFMGWSNLETDVVILDGYSIAGSFFELLTVSGESGGGSGYFIRSILQNVTNLQGVAENSGFGGSFTLGNVGTYFMCTRCNAIDDCTFDMLGPGRVLKLSVGGDIIVENLQTLGELSLGMNYGSVVLSSSCTGGTANISGVCEVTDNSGEGCIVTRNAQIDSSPGIYGGFVHIDESSLYSGTNSPVGTRSFPVNNLADAYAIANDINLNSYRVTGNVDINIEGHVNWFFEGASNTTSVITLVDGYDYTGSNFNTTRIEGTCNSLISANQCTIGGLAGISGNFYDCVFTGNISVTDTAAAALYILNGSGGSGPAAPNLTVGATHIVGATNLTGEWIIKDVQAGAPPSVVAIYGSGADITFDSSCSGGTAETRGVATTTDNSTGMILTDSSINLQNIDAYLSAIHGSGDWEGSGSVQAIDAYLSAIHGDGSWEGTGDTSQIATAVWNKVLSGAYASNTAGRLLYDSHSHINDIVTQLTRALGLLHENTFIDNTTHDSFGQMTLARIRIFSSKAAALGATDGGSETSGLIETYDVETEYEGQGKMKSYRVVKR